MPFMVYGKPLETNNCIRAKPTFKFIGTTYLKIYEESKTEK